jgi:hypothetical protein
VSWMKIARRSSVHMQRVTSPASSILVISLDSALCVRCTYSASPCIRMSPPASCTCCSTSNSLTLIA